MQAYSSTSTAFTPNTKATAALISNQEWLLQNVKGLGHLQVKTSLGDLHLELNCPLAPRACYNMIQLAKKGYFDDTLFHRFDMEITCKIDKELYDSRR